tara:strand:+ start:742 stop:948 length:207 start_codon:yes stop_codon:yes gene_type:complete
MIYQTPNGYYVASSKQVWKAGIYDSERAARYCFQFPDSELKALQERKNKVIKVITFEDLQELRRQKKQ